MIKVGKIQVNQNISPKTLLILSIFSLVICLILCGYTISSYLKTKDYIKINAIITDVGWYYTASNNNNLKNYIKIDYEYENQTYNNKHNVWFRFNKEVGSLTEIYINPNNPNEIRDTYNINISFILSIVTLFTTLLLIKSYKIRKNGSYF